MSGNALGNLVVASGDRHPGAQGRPGTAEFMDCGAHLLREICLSLPALVTRSTLQKRRPEAVRFSRGRSAWRSPDATRPDLAEGN